MNMKRWVKEMVVDNKEFRVTFWRDNLGLMWTRLEEKVLVRGWFGKIREDYNLIREYWTDDDPIEVSCQEIAKYLTDEKNKVKYEKELDRLCDLWYN